ncbi:substrate-binding domain-containing protein [Pseudomaricurvus alkylphenolicus]|uniref:substrate-binding domain-containing protein n=1 Tax=Pseudomaricurvus alkylphenolicus TaxID=1306991 RepID=UPI00197CE183|nr:hypothetical protein [Pseudomaricurvus alkylphenolicus]
MRRYLSRCLILWLCLAGPSMADARLTLNPPPHVESLSLNEVRAIFSMRVRAWPDGSPITVFVLPDDDPQHQTFVRQVLTLLPHQLRRNWNRLVYTGIGQAPVEVASETEMRRRLAATPGSIGYLNTDANEHKGNAHGRLVVVSLR